MVACNETSRVLSDPWYWGSNAIKLILAPPAITFNIILIYILTRCVLLHVNVRYLLINLSACSVVASAYLLQKGLTTLSYFLLDRICSLERSSMACYIREAVYVLFKLPVLGSMLGLGIERMYSTRHADIYTQYESPRLAIVLLCVLWSLSGGMVAVLMLTAPSDQEIVYCNALFVYNNVAIEALALALLPLELLGVSLYAYIWAASVRLSYMRLLPACLKAPYHPESFALSSRLQYRHNVAITAMMLPSVLFHAACWTTILGVALAQINLGHFTQLTHLLLSQYLFYSFALAHMTIHPLLCLWNCDILRWELVKLCPRLQIWFPDVFQQGILARQQSRQAEKHFQLLTNMWEKHKPMEKDGTRKKRNRGGAGRVKATGGRSSSISETGAVGVKRESHRTVVHVQVELAQEPLQPKSPIVQESQF